MHVDPEQIQRVIKRKLYENTTCKSSSEHTAHQYIVKYVGHVPYFLILEKTKEKQLQVMGDLRYPHEYHE